MSRTLSQWLDTVGQNVAQTLLQLDLRVVYHWQCIGFLYEELPRTTGRQQEL